MEDMIKRLENYNSNSEKYKTQKISILINAKKIYKGKKWFLMHLKILYFHCLNNIHLAWMIGRKMSQIHDNVCVKNLTCYYLFSVKRELKKKIQKKNCDNELID